jgi:hypothetical protein
MAARFPPCEKGSQIIIMFEWPMPKSCRGTLAKRRLYLDQLTTTGKTIAWLLNFRRTLFQDPEIRL